MPQPQPQITPELVVRAYCAGAFPMAEGRDGEVHWYCPDPRAIMPLHFEQAPDDGGFHVPRSLRKAIRRTGLTFTYDADFPGVVRACAQPRPYTDETWINDRIIDVYTELHHAGLAHSIEAWDGGRLVGGIYGVALGAAFFGESMFSRVTDASKMCLVRLVRHLGERDFTLLDVQMTNPHLERFGIELLPHEAYMQRLDAALRRHRVTW